MVIHLTTVHSRCDVRIFYKMCASLICAGFDASLIVADGRGASVQGGVDIYDLGLQRFRFLRMVVLPFKALLLIERLKPRLVHFHDPELLLLGLWLRLRGVKVIYDSHEDVPKQILGKNWIPEIIRPAVSKAFELLEVFVVRRLSAVVAATEIIANRFCGVQGNVITVNNFPILKEFPVLNSVLPVNTICYVGCVARARGIVELVSALEYLPKVRLLIAGKFESEALFDEVSGYLGWKQVEYFGFVGRDRVAEIMAMSCVGVVTLRPLPNYLESLPIKMFEYMASGLPVIASDFPLWRALIVEADSGVCVNPLSPSDIAGAIARLLNNPEVASKMGAAGRRMVEDRYNWDAEFVKLIRLYEHLF